MEEVRLHAGLDGWIVQATLCETHRTELTTGGCQFQFVVLLREKTLDTERFDGLLELPIQEVLTGNGRDLLENLLLRNGRGPCFARGFDNSKKN